MRNGEELRIRAAVGNDLAAIVALYNHYVKNSHVTFDTEPFTKETRRSWFEGFTPDGPYRLLAAYLGTDLVGYTCSSPFKPKPGHRTSVETTIYVDPAFTGRGIGRRLYAELLDALDNEATLHRAYGGIALPNDGSIALHEGLGFERVATYREVGMKLGRFWDVSWYERDLGDISPA